MFPNSCPKWKFGLPDVQLLACASSETTEPQWHRLYVAFTAVHPSTRKSHNLPTWVFAELRRATGLFAHGIGIGAFVYLRRIFENLVESAREAADPNDERKDEFFAMTMTGRIKELTAQLPPASVSS